MGLRVLITSGRTAGARGFRIVVIAPAGPVRDVLDHAGIGELVPVADSMTAARALLAKGGAAGR
jgi:hypothetical protein